LEKTDALFNYIGTWKQTASGAEGWGENNGAEEYQNM